jgi:hypothetical protein
MDRFVFIVLISSVLSIPTKHVLVDSIRLANAPVEIQIKQHKSVKLQTIFEVLKPLCLVIILILCLQDDDSSRNSLLKSVNTLNRPILSESEKSELEISKNAVKQIITISLASDEAEYPRESHLILRERLAAIDPSKTYMKHFLDTQIGFSMVDETILDYVSYFWRRDASGMPYNLVAPMSLSTLLGQSATDTTETVSTPLGNELSIELLPSSLTRTVKFLNKHFGPLRQIFEPVSLFISIHYLSYLLENRNFLSKRDERVKELCQPRNTAYIRPCIQATSNRPVP